VIKVGEKVDNLATKVCDVSQGYSISSEKFAWVEDIASFEAKSRANLAVNNITPSGVTARSRSRSWKITYSTVKDMDRGRMKAYDGTLELDEIDQWLHLRCARGIQIGCRSLQKGDQFSIGAKLFFPIHIVRIGIAISAGTSSSTRDCMVHAGSTVVLMTNKEGTSTATKAPETSAVLNSVPPEDMPARAHLDLSMSHGKNFSKDVHHKFGSTVNPSEKVVIFSWWFLLVEQLFGLMRRQLQLLLSLS
jgi:hypothetical protein